MISSSLIDMGEYRDRLIRILKQNGFQPIVCEERPPADSKSPAQRSKDLVKECDIFLCIIADRYGTIASDEGRSYTEIEFIAALEHEKKIPMLVFIKEQSQVQKDFVGNAENIEEAVKEFNQRKGFIERIYNSGERTPTVAEYTNIDNLENQILTSLVSSSALRGRNFFAAHSYDLLQTALCGREKEKQQLTSWRNNNSDNYPICIVEALGGMGKSALAWTWAREASFNNLDSYRVFWYSFYETTAGYEDFIRQLATYLRPQNKLEVAIPLSDCEKICHKGIEENQILIILDGFEATFQGYSHTTKQVDAVALNKRIAKTKIYRQDKSLLSFRKISDTRLSSFMNTVRTKGGLSSKILITSRYLPTDLQQKTGEPLNRVQEILLKEFSFQETKLYWKERGLLENDPGLQSLHEAVSGWPLALAVASGSISRGQLIEDFYRRNPNFNPFRENATSSERRSDVFKAALVELDETQAIILKSIAAFRFPLKRESLVALLSSSDSNNYASYEHRLSRPLLHQVDDNSIDQSIDSLQDRKLIGYELGRLSMHPVVRHAVRSRNIGGSMQDIIGTAQSVPVPHSPSSISDLEIHIGLASIYAEQQDFEEAVGLVGLELKTHLEKLEANRESYELYSLFFETNESENQIHVTWKPDPKRFSNFGFWVAGKSDFSLKLSTQFKSIGRPDFSNALYQIHEQSGICKDPMCEISNKEALEALGKLSLVEETIFNTVNRTKSKESQFLTDGLSMSDVRDRLTLENHTDLLEQYNQQGFILNSVAYYRMYSTICDHNIQVSKAKDSIGYFFLIDKLVNKEKDKIYNYFDGKSNYLISRNLRLAAICLSIGRKSKAVDISKQCLLKAKKCESIKYKRASNVSLAKAYLEKKKFSLAIQHIDDARNLKIEERGTIREADLLLLLAEARFRALEFREASSLVKEIRTLAEHGMDRQIRAKATFIEAKIQGQQHYDNEEKELLVKCLKEFRDPYEQETPMLYKEQRNSVRRLKELGNLTEDQLKIMNSMRPAKSFSAVITTRGVLWSLFRNSSAPARTIW